MARFAGIRGKEAWVNFIRGKAPGKRAPGDTMRSYMNRVASLAGHPGENPSIPSLRDAIHELITQGEIEPFARGNAKSSKKKGGRRKAQSKQRRGKKPLPRAGNRQNRSSPVLGLVLEMVELNSRTDRVLALVAGQLASLVERVSPLFEHTREIEETKERLREASRDLEEMEKAIGEV